MSGIHLAIKVESPRRMVCYSMQWHNLEEPSNRLSSSPDLMCNLILMQVSQRRAQFLSFSATLAVGW